VARGVVGFDGEAFDDWPPEIRRRRIALQKIDDLDIEGLKGGNFFSWLYQLLDTSSTE
jgi:hypothetical protein